MLSALAFGLADDTCLDLDYSGYHKKLHPIIVSYLDLAKAKSEASILYIFNYLKPKN